MTKQPLVSFCIATYKRPEFIKSTIEIILNQKYKNVEIIISEDDSNNTCEQIVKSFNSKKIIYHKNKTHLGMVKSFNKAFSLSKGDFVTILADDDPPTKNMLSTFEKALNKYPKSKAFWGASFAFVTTKKLERVIHLKQGFNSLINKNLKYGKTYVLKSDDFFKDFFTQKIFPHYLWNASLISRDLVEKIKGVPFYNSAHFSDYAYLIKIADQTDFVIINKEMASFSLHELNYGRGKNTLDEYKRGVIGFNKIAYKLSKKYNAQKEYEKFLANYIIMFLVNRYEHFKAHGIKISTKELFKIYADLSKQINFLKNGEKDLNFKLNYKYKFNSFFNLFDIARKTYGNVKNII
jgi:glycosyltransferase involved in cell wall biosynthesis